MEYIDEDARPRFVFQSRPLPSSSTDEESQQKPLNKLRIICTILSSSLLLILSILFVEVEPFKSLLFWVSISFIIGPFAPSNITGGDIRVGRGPIIEPIEEEPEIVAEKRVPKKRSKQVRSEEPIAGSVPVVETTHGLTLTERKTESLTKSDNGLVSNEREEKWTEEDLEMLKKQMVKNPVGKPRRWEVISGAFNGRHRVESVIKMAKEMGERKLGDSDSYARFLKNRKPLDTRVRAEINGIENGMEARKDSNDCGIVWSSGEDIALLNAMKTFPKDVAMRWEKIAAAVPGKSKAACMKRISELKKEFRSSKAGTEN